MRINARLFIVLVGIISFAGACSDDSSGTDGGDDAHTPNIGGDADGDSDTDVDGDTDADGDGDGDGDYDTITTSDNVCFEEENFLKKLPARIMLLQDISSSMNEHVDGATKWEIAQSALTTMMAQYGDTVEFGLDFFPIDTDCGVGTTVAQDAAPDNGGNLAQVLANTDLNRTTPLLHAMANFLNPAYARAFTADGADPYLVVVSDGEDTCGGESQFGGGSTADALANVTSRLLAAGIRTFVIGFGDQVDPKQLNAIAAAGGTQFTTYFDAQNEQQLNGALASIGQTVNISCRYELGTITGKAERASTQISFDGKKILKGEQCTGNAGWMWGNAARTIVEFCPDECAMLESNGVDHLRVVMDCSTDTYCYEEDQGLSESTARVMLLQDISSSMNDHVDGATKWEIDQGALTAMVAQYGDTVQFGLDFFPIDEDCGVGSIVGLDAAPNNGTNVANVVATTGLNRTTPLLFAMANFLNPLYAPVFAADGAEPYLVVVSDGKDTCGGEDQYGGGSTAEALANVTARLLAAGIRTFAVGFGNGVDPSQLNAIAAAGGTQYTTYFDAQNEADLNQALDSIGQTVRIACRYQLGTISEEADRNSTTIHFDGQKLVRGEECIGDADWMWGNEARSIVQFCVDECTMLENDEVGQLRVTMGCRTDDTDTDTDLDSDTGSDADTDSGTDNDTGADTDTDTDLVDSDTGSDTDKDTDADTDTDTDTIITSVE